MSRVDGISPKAGEQILNTCPGIELTESLPRLYTNQRERGREDDRKSARCSTEYLTNRSQGRYKQAFWAELLRRW